MVAAAVLAGCGSIPASDLPPAAGPADSPALTTAPVGTVDAGPAPAVAPARVRLGGTTQVATVDGRERMLELRDARTGRRMARAGAGIGPTNVAAAGGRLYVTDTAGDALLVYTTTPKLELVRRVYLPGAPYAIVSDPGRYRLWVTLTGRNELVELPAHGKPHVLRRLPTVRQPDAVAVDPATGRLVVSGRGGERQVITP